MPLDPFHRFPIPDVAQHGKMSHATTVSKQPSLPLAQPDGDVAQWLAVLRLCLLVRHEHYFSALPIYTRLGLPVGLPFLFRNFPNGLAQRLAHPHADRKTNASLRMSEALREAIREVPEKEWRSEEHTSELQSQSNLVCRLL